MFRTIIKSFISNLTILFREEPLALGRWNRKHTEKYMEWGNTDNCYNNMNHLDIR